MELVAQQLIPRDLAQELQHFSQDLGHNFDSLVGGFMHSFQVRRGWASCTGTEKKGRSPRAPGLPYPPLQEGYRLVDSVIRSTVEFVGSQLGRQRSPGRGGGEDEQEEGLDAEGPSGPDPSYASDPFRLPIRL